MVEKTGDGEEAEAVRRVMQIGADGEERRKGIVRAKA